jgi:deoxyribose-phosphate aldolase
VKAILETGYFTESELSSVAVAALNGGCDFLKTSTGFGPRGASVRDVELLKEWAQGRASIKAAGGIRTVEEAQQFIDAGATRLGTSRGVALVAG